MIVETVVNFGVGLLCTMFGMINFISLPYDAMNVLSTITGYGAYVVGSDLLLLIFSCVAMWWTIKTTAGLLLFIYKLLPLT